ncbi:MAG TPA: DUF2493 domain-containing protein [Kaistia sp.]|jgi:hypothetical protein|nr:DUF2493 domain-containing protein [Kaistia sp.]
MRVLVCGGRDFADRPRLNVALDGLKPSFLIHGGAPGADALADYWADIRGIPHRTFPADWNTHGKAAGPIRNQRMIDEGKPDLVIAFPGGRGTADMIRRAKAAGIPVREG